MDRLVVKIVGIGTGGCQAVNYVYNKGTSGVDFVFIDSSAFDYSNFAYRLWIDTESTEGGPAYASEIGRKAAEAKREEIKAALQGANVIFLIDGMGGSTGNGAAPVVAEIAQSLDGNYLTVGIVTRPFKFEGEHRFCQAQEGIDLLKEKVDSLLVIPNEGLRTLDPDLTSQNTFEASDKVICHAVQSITDLFLEHKLVGIDLADVVSVMKNAGLAYIGIGLASGKNNVVKAAQEAMLSPLLESPVCCAQGVIVSYYVPPKVDLKDINGATTMIYNATSENVNLIWNFTFDEKSEDETCVTIITTDIGKKDRNDLPPPLFSDR